MGSGICVIAKAKNVPQRSSDERYIFRKFAQGNRKTVTPEILKYVVMAFATINFGYMVVDGLRAIIKGDYIRPSTGPYAGQLGPWTTVVQRLGIEPESALMKRIFVVIGVLGLVATVLYTTDKIDELPMLIVALLSIWNLYLGTLISILMILLLVAIMVLR
jgi:hypothetical protein